MQPLHLRYLQHKQRADQEQHEEGKDAMKPTVMVMVVVVLLLLCSLIVTLVVLVSIPASTRCLRHCARGSTAL